MEAPRMAVDTLKALLDEGKPVIVLDVRQPESYAGSNKKIRGSRYINPNDEEALKAFASLVGKDSPIVTY